VIDCPCVKHRRAPSWRPAIVDHREGRNDLDTLLRGPSQGTMARASLVWRPGAHVHAREGLSRQQDDLRWDSLPLLRKMAAANHGKKRALAVEILPQPRQADSGGHKRLRPMGAVFGGETRLLAVFGRFPASEAAGSGIIVSSASSCRPKETCQE
jgi:hypothetical protein